MYHSSSYESLRHTKTPFNLYQFLKDRPDTLLATIDPYHQLHDLKKPRYGSDKDRYSENDYSEFNVEYAIAGLHDKPDLLLPVLQSISARGIHPEKADYEKLLTTFRDKPEHLTQVLIAFYPHENAQKAHIPNNALALNIKYLSANKEAFRFATVCLAPLKLSVAPNLLIDAYKDKPANHLLDAINCLQSGTTGNKLGTLITTLYKQQQDKLWDSDKDKTDQSSTLMNNWLARMVTAQLEASNHEALKQLLMTDNAVSQLITADNLCDTILRIQHLKEIRDGLVAFWQEKQQSQMTEMPPLPPPVLHPAAFTDHPAQIIDALPLLQSLGAQTNWQQHDGTFLTSIVKHYRDTDRPGDLPGMMAQMRLIDQNNQLPDTVIGSVIAVLHDQPEMLTRTMDQLVVVGVAPTRQSIHQAIVSFHTRPEEMIDRITYLQQNGAPLNADHITTAIRLCKDEAITPVKSLIPLLKKHKVTPTANNITTIFSTEHEFYKKPKLFLALMSHLVPLMDKEEAEKTFVAMVTEYGSFFNLRAHGDQHDPATTALGVLSLLDVHHQIRPSDKHMVDFTTHHAHDESFFAAVANRLVMMGARLPSGRHINRFIKGDGKSKISYSDRVLLTIRGGLTHTSDFKKETDLHLAVMATHAMYELPHGSPLRQPLKDIAETGHRILDHESIAYLEYEQEGSYEYRLGKFINNIPADHVEPTG